MEWTLITWVAAASDTVPGLLICKPTDRVVLTGGTSDWFRPFDCCTKRRTTVSRSVTCQSELNPSSLTYSNLTKAHAHISNPNLQCSKLRQPKLLANLWVDGCRKGNWIHMSQDWTPNCNTSAGIKSQQVKVPSLMRNTNLGLGIHGKL